MNRMLIAAAPLLAGPAQAVDYAKCEAMTNAYNRINASKLELMRSLNNDQLEVLRASLANRDPKNEPEYVTEIWKYEARLDPIRADYEKAKCP